MVKNIIQDAKGILVVQAATIFSQGFKYLFWSPADERYFVLTYDHSIDEETGLFISKTTGHDVRECKLADAKEYWVQINEELFPIHRMNWARLAGMKYEGGEEIEIGLNEYEAGNKIAHIKDLVIESLQDIQSLYKLGMIPPYMAIRLAYKLGQQGLGAKIFVTDFK
jgi:hypothetical protein